MVGRETYPCKVEAVPASSGPHCRVIEKGDPATALTAEMSPVWRVHFCRSIALAGAEEDSMSRHVRPEPPVCVLRHVPTTNERSTVLDRTKPFPKLKNSPVTAPCFRGNRDCTWDDTTMNTGPRFLSQNF